MKNDIIDIIIKFISGAIIGIVIAAILFFITLYIMGAFV